jgi:hypothetical protein
MQICKNCNKEINTLGYDTEWFALYHHYGKDIGVHDYLCSASCLIEFSWGIRLATPKLSKSKQEQVNDSL